MCHVILGEDEAGFGEAKVGVTPAFAAGGHRTAHRSSTNRSISSS
jgi:hypothetical protein